MNIKMKQVLITGVLGFLLVCAGCVSNSDKPVAQLATANAAIKDAVQSGGREAAAIELRRADQHLAAAKEAVDNEEYIEARRFAEKAEADAKLAEAKADSAEARNNVRELQEGIRVLRQELENQ